MKNKKHLAVIVIIAVVLLSSLYICPSAALAKSDHKSKSDHITPTAATAMDWKEFSIKASEQIVNLIRYIAWPAIVLAIVLLFKKQLTGLINRIKKLNLKDKSLDFAPFNSLNEEIDQINANTNNTTIQKLCDIEPTSVNADLWLRLVTKTMLCTIQYCASLLRCK